jgi:hypothetical protein
LISCGWIIPALGGVFAAFTFYFFRDPDALVPTGKNLVLAPGHGKVDTIDSTTETDFMGGECQRISIFLSVFDVHVQNAPLTGTCRLFQTFSRANISTPCAPIARGTMRTFWWASNSVEPAGTKVGVRLIAGLIARRDRAVGDAERSRATRRTHQPDSVWFARGGLSAARPDQGPIGRPRGGRRSPSWPNSLLKAMEMKPSRHFHLPAAGWRAAEDLFSAESADGGKFVLRFRGAHPDCGGQPRAGPGIQHGRLHARSSSPSAVILLACIFDLFDGRVARMGGHESPFGREFDSLADLVSFGAGARLSWFIAWYCMNALTGRIRRNWAGSLPRFTCLCGPSGWRDSTAFPP